MEFYSDNISRLVENLSVLPGIGAKTAQRLAFHILGMPQEQVEKMAAAIVDAKRGIHFCKECQTLTVQNFALFVQIKKETTAQ